MHRHLIVDLGKLVLGTTYATHLRRAVAVAYTI